MPFGRKKHNRNQSQNEQIPSCSKWDQGVILNRNDALISFSFLTWNFGFFVSLLTANLLSYTVCVKFHCQVRNHLYIRIRASVRTSFYAAAVCEIFQALCNRVLVPVTRCQTLFKGLMGSTSSGKSVDVLAPSTGAEQVKSQSQSQERAESCLVTHRLCLETNLNQTDVLGRLLIFDHKFGKSTWDSQEKKKKKGNKGVQKALLEERIATVSNAE